MNWLEAQQAAHYLPGGLQRRGPPVTAGCRTHSPASAVAALK